MLTSPLYVNMQEELISQNAKSNFIKASKKQYLPPPPPTTKYPHVII